MTRESATKLRRCPVDSVSPYALMLSPVYIWFNRNKKFLAVKSPLDFFTPEELERYQKLQNFFVPESVDAAIPFQSAAQSAKAIMSWVPKTKAQYNPGKEGKESYPEILLPVSPYEISDAMIQILGPLWAEGLRIEPFFVSVFCSELCDLLPGEVLEAARNQNIDQFETAILRSAWAVFLALHLGKCELIYLNRLRRKIFDLTMEEKYNPKSKIIPIFGDEQKELFQLVRACIPNPNVQVLSGRSFDERDERIAHKLFGRFSRVENKLIKKNAPMPSIFGPKGFCDV